MCTCNGFRLVPRRVWSHEQHFVSRRLRPGRAVRPEHIHFRRAPVLVRQRGERCAPSSFVLRLKRHRFRDGKLLVQATDETLVFFVVFVFCVPLVVSRRRVFNIDDGKKWSSSSSVSSSSLYMFSRRKNNTGRRRRRSSETCRRRHGMCVCIMSFQRKALRPLFLRPVLTLNVYGIK
jgi:hypothetical protein